MLGENALYIIGLFLVSLFLVFGFDDFIWDLVTLARRFRSGRARLDMNELDKTPPRMLAVIIAAWHEDNVLEDVIDNFVESTHYPKSMYHIFLGVYPNDGPTIAAARVLEARHENVHVVINEKPGPTCKAQNINYVIRRVKDFELQRGQQFISFTIHDSEDVVHPYELKVTNYLIDKHDALQFPVFPIQEMPRFGNFIRNLTTGTYVDEFAENHYITMMNRYESGSFVPSAGTGLALSRRVIDLFGDGDVLPDGSLTEDYRLSLTLYERGVRIYYVLEKVPRLSPKGKQVWDYIATRSIFPATFSAAVRQKTRWILGITMQSFKMRSIFNTRGISLMGRYSMYKDLKAKYANLLSFSGYPVLIYFFVSFFVPLAPIFPAGTVSWYLSILVSVMMVERQIMRSVAIYKVYGMRSVFFSCLLPPLLPIRLIWGNLINLTATFKAHKQNLFGTGPRKARKKKVAWAKTDHAFLAKSVLRRYHRKIGDVLLGKGYVTSQQMHGALTDAKRDGRSVGIHLREKEHITERELVECLSLVKHVPFVENVSDYDLRLFVDDFEQADLRRYLAFPLAKNEQTYVMAFCDESPSYAQEILQHKYNCEISIALTLRSTAETVLDEIYTPANR